MSTMDDVEVRYQRVREAIRVRLHVDVDEWNMLQILLRQELSHAAEHAAMCDLLDGAALPGEASLSTLRRILAENANRAAGR